MLDRMSDSIQGSRIENLHSREVDRQSPTGLIFCISYFRRDWQIKFRPVWAFTLFCVEVQMLHHHQSYRSLNSWLLPLYKCLYHRLPDVMLSVCVFSAGHIHCWSVSWWQSQSLRVNAFEFWHARGPSGLAKDLVCAPTLQAYVVRMFSVCSGRRGFGAVLLLSSCQKH